MTWIRRLSLRGPVADAALGALAAVSILAATSPIEADGDRPLDALGYACIVVAGGALAGRRRWPLAVVGVVTAALAVYLGFGYPGGPVFVTLFVVLYTVATLRPRRQAVTVGIMAAGALVLVGELAGTGPGLVHLLFVGWAAAAVFLGDAVQSHRAHLATLEARARELEQSREEEARRRVAEERLRIARDLHDSVAHTMATINVQSGMAAHVIERHPDRAKEALGAIQQASGDVLDELAALLGLLRLEGAEPPELAPIPGPPELEALVETAGRSGVDVTLRVDADLARISQPVGVALYRIVQESLTNVMRHAGPDARATVRVVDEAGGLSVEVVDDGGRRLSRAGEVVGGNGAGVGITGMRERAAATGGDLMAGPREDGGFEVRATWPVRT